MLNALQQFERESWRDDAACLAFPTEWWFPGPGPCREETVVAIAICIGCPVREACREEGVRHAYDVHGIWGGMNQRKRIAIRKGRLGNKGNGRRRKVDHG